MRKSNFKRKPNLDGLSYDELPAYLLPTDYLDWCDDYGLRSLMNITDIEVSNADLIRVCPDATTSGCLVDWMHDELEEVIFNILSEKVVNIYCSSPDGFVDTKRLNGTLERLSWLKGNIYKIGESA